MADVMIESGVQLFARLIDKKCLYGVLPLLFPNGGPYENQVIEISGDNDDIVVEFQIDLITRCILPENLKENWKGAEAVIILNEHQMDLLKIIKILEYRLDRVELKQTKKMAIENCLKRLTLVNCYSPVDLEMSIMNLERIIRNNPNIALVVIDNITSHYWISKSDTMSLSYHQYSLKLFETLREVTNDLKVVVMFTRQERSDQKKELPNIDHKFEIVTTGNKYTVVATDKETQDITQVQFVIDVVLKYEQIGKST